MSLKTIVSSYFQNLPEKEFANIINLFFIRKDGIVVYDKSYNGGPENSSLGALSSGVWQACQSLGSMVFESESFGEFRLSFDTSSKGYYLLPIALMNQEFYLGALYQGENNPGYLKNKLRSFAMGIKKVLPQEMPGEGDMDKSFLFNNITDNEIDDLFSFVGKH